MSGVVGTFAVGGTEGAVRHTAERVARRAKERKRLQEEVRATREAYHRRRDHASEIAMARAEKALEDFDGEPPPPAA